MEELIPLIREVFFDNNFAILNDENTDRQSRRRGHLADMIPDYWEVTGTAVRRINQDQADNFERIRHREKKRREGEVGSPLDS